MKRWIAAVLALALALGLCGCGAKESGKAAIFWYSFQDTFLADVRSAMDAAWLSAGIEYENYDAGGRQAVQNEQIQKAISDGASVLVVNIVDASFDDTTRQIVDTAKKAGIPLVFFNRSISEEILSGYQKAVYVGTNYEMAGHMQGQMIGSYLVAHFEELDLNGDSFLSYVMFKGQEGNEEADARTKYAVEDANVYLAQAGKPELRFYDDTNAAKYLVDQDGAWSFEQGKDYMQNILERYSEADGNMPELIIANNDSMALGAVAALQEAGYNNGTGRTIPVFGVDATKEAQEGIAQGSMTGTILQDADAMGRTAARIAANMISGKTPFDGVEAGNIVSAQRVNIPYSFYTGE